MANPPVVFKVEFQAGTQQFAAGANSVVNKLNEISSHPATKPGLKPDGEKAGHELGEGMEHGLHGKFRHLRHVVHLFAGVLGGIMGQSFEHSFGKTAMAGIGGAMGGMFLTPGNPILGAGVGAVAAILGAAFASASERTKKLVEIADHFKISLEEIKEMAKTGLEPDAIAKSLEHWNELLQGIAEKKPEVIKALKAIGIEGSDALNRFAGQPAQRGQQILARGIGQSLPGLGALSEDKRKSFEEARAQAVAEWKASGAESMSLPSEKAMRTVSAAEINDLLKKGPKEEGDKFVEKVVELFGGVDKWLESLNAGALQLGPLGEFDKRAAVLKAAGKPTGFGEKDLPAPDSLAKAGIFLTGGVGGENYQNTTIGLLSQIAAKVDGVKEAVKSHEQTTKAQ